MPSRARRDFVPAHRGRAELADLDAGGQVRELGGGLGLAAAEERHGEDADDGVAGAGDVVNLASRSGNVQRRALRPQERHALVAARDQEAAAVNLGEHLVTGAGDLLVVVCGNAGRGFELLAVGRDEIETEVAGVIGALGIGQDGLALLLGGATRRGQQLAREDALAVVAADDAGDMGGAGRYAFDELLLQLVADALPVLAVDAEDLLGVGHDAELRRGGAMRVLEDVLRVHADVGKELAQAGALVVAAADADEPDLAAEGHEVLGHVGGATQSVVVRLPFNDLHRRLGRDAVDVPPDVLVEHQVADDEDLGSSAPVEGVAQGGVRSLHDALTPGSTVSNLGPILS